VPKMTFYEAVRKAKEERDHSIEQSRARANERLAERVKELMVRYDETVSNAARGLGWSRMHLYRIGITSLILNETDDQTREEDQREET